MIPQSTTLEASRNSFDYKEQLPKIWKHPKWIKKKKKKKPMRHLHTGILLSHKKEENYNLCKSMDEPGEHYAK